MIVVGGIVALIQLAATVDSQAQRVLGRVLDETTRTAIVGAVVTAKDQDGDIVAYGISDQIGEYALSLPAFGTYSFDAESIGYGRRIASDILVEDRLPLLMHFELAPRPIEVEGIEAETRRVRPIDLQLQRLGLGANEVDETRIVTREEIAARQTSRDIGAVLEWQNISGTKIVRSQNFSAGNSAILCVAQLRARTMGRDRCSLTVLNGTVIGLDAALMIDPDDLENIVILTPVQATLTFGTAGGGGAVLLYTRMR